MGHLWVISSEPAEALKPHDVGLPEHGRRRVPGLRREEVALLAGVSSDYYVRLEQGAKTVRPRRCSRPWHKR